MRQIVPASIALFLLLLNYAECPNATSAAENLACVKPLVESGKYLTTGVKSKLTFLRHDVHVILRRVRIEPDRVSVRASLVIFNHYKSDFIAFGFRFRRRKLRARGRPLRPKVKSSAESGKGGGLLVLSNF